MFAARKIIDFVKKVLNFIKSITIVPAVKIILFIMKLLKKLVLYIFAHRYYVRRRNALKRKASRGFNLYKANKSEKLPSEILKAVKLEVRKQAQIEKSNKKQKFPREKTRPYKYNNYKNKKSQTQILGDLKSLSSIKFK